MRNALVIAALLSLAVLFIAGCDAGVVQDGELTEKEAAQPEETASQPETTVVAAEDNTLGGAILSVDSIDSELNDPELDMIDEYLDEVNW